MFAYSEQAEVVLGRPPPVAILGSMPRVHVEDTDEAYQSALAAGEESLEGRHDVMPAVRIALVRAPGGVPFGLSG